MTMWMATPAYFAVVLIKVIWFNGYADEHTNLWNIPPEAKTTTTIESSVKQCKVDGTKWELEGEKSVLKDDAPIMNGAWRCVVVATGGLEAGYANGD